jgi:D-alanyl-D-alanine carboxypeptidase (penicillin-binding protein 5/6)
MTAFLLLRDHPLNGGDGFVLAVTAADVGDTARRRSQDQSLIPVTVDERLTERQALQALLIPSANNIAVMLAKYDRGGVAAFVAEMNAQAKALGMLRTTYTDPSGFRPDTVSTAADQLKLLAVAMRQPVIAEIVGRAEVTLPVAGTVSNTDTLLGRDGFVGVKTGSDDDAGGCFMFDSRQVIQGHLIHVVGVVLGQRAGPLIPAALTAAERLVDSVVSHLSGSDPIS